MAVYAERRRQLQEVLAQASRAACAGSKDSRAVCGDSGCDGSGGAGVSAGAIFAWRLMSLATCRHRTDRATLCVRVSKGA